MIAAGGGTSWSPVVLLDISTHGLSIASAQLLASGDMIPIRFTLPGMLSQHCAFITLLFRSTEGVPTGFRYGARFTVIEPATRDHIVNFLSAPVAA